MAKAKTKTYRWGSPRGLAGLVTLLVGLNVLTYMTSLAVILRFGEAAHYTEDGDLTGPRTLMVLVDIAALLCMVLCCVASVLWVLRVCRNAHTFRPGLKTSPFGSVGWYVVPFAGLYKPYESMSEIWSASTLAEAPAKDQLLNWWWGLFLLVNFMAWATQAADKSGAGLWAPVEVGYDLLVIASSIVFLLLVHRLSGMQMEKRRQATSDPPGSVAGGSLQSVF